MSTVVIFFDSALIAFSHIGAILDWATIAASVRLGMSSSDHGRILAGLWRHETVTAAG